MRLLKLQKCFISALFTPALITLVLYYMFAGSPLRSFEDNPQSCEFDRALEVPNFDTTTNELEDKIMNRFEKQNNIDLKHLSSNTENTRTDIEEMRITLKNYDKKGTILANVSSHVFETKQTKKPTSLLTIFTTWKQNVENSTDMIHKNTLKNWSSFKPIFNPVVFTNDTALAGIAEKYGWLTLPITKAANNGLPILKYMYIDAIRKFRSNLYCYANSDILFDDGLLDTLVQLLFKLDTETITSTPMFLTGLRWNVINVLEHEITPREKIRSLVKIRGEVFCETAEDYFITNAVYPWYDIPDLVISAVAFDNWLVFNARARKHFTIDTSRTILAVHQSLDENNGRSHKRETANYNDILLKKIYKTIPYHNGFINCIEIMTDFANDTLILGVRKVDPNCNKP